MKMVPDRSGRFPERPHFDPADLDVACERLVTEFLMDRHGRVHWPVTTDDLTCLIECHVDDLDLFADLSADGSDVEGLTEFAPGRRPRVRISATLASADHRANRLRTTLTHELGHVQFHGFLFELRGASLDLFDTAGGAREPHSNTGPNSATQKCHRNGILNAAERDWMEWQAGYACGAFLMPATPLKSLVRDFNVDRGVLREILVSSPEAAILIAAVANRFDVSHDAARVRLLKAKHLVNTSTGRSIFE
jgi:IrrE N-terminal-like domain